MDANETNFLRRSGGESARKLTNRRLSSFPKESLRVGNNFAEFAENFGEFQEESEAHTLFN